MVHVGREEERELEKKRKYKKLKRYTAIGLATIGGGAVLGLTGGLAAPFIGAGLGTIIGTGELKKDEQILHTLIFCQKLLFLSGIIWSQSLFLRVKN